MLNMTCIVCPIGCSLEVEENGDSLIVTGNKCPRGVAYAQEEVRAPKRVVTATCRAVNSRLRVPVKTSAPCPKEKISALLRDIYNAKATLPVNVGDVVIKDWQGLGVDIVATRSLEGN